MRWKFHWEKMMPKSNEVNQEIIEDYKKLEQECNIVLSKIEERKRRKKIRIVDVKS
jgi:hypothetical protein